MHTSESIDAVSRNGDCGTKTGVQDNPLYRKAVKGLAKRVSGYLCKETKTTFEYGPDGEKRLKSEIVTRKQVPPDFSAITFTLNCLAPRQWNARHPDPEELGPEELADLSGLSEEALREISGLLED